MAFESFAEFLQMGRHGIYVWSAYGLTIFTLVAVVGVSKWRFSRWKHKMLRQIARETRQQEKLQPNGE